MIYQLFHLIPSKTKILLLTGLMLYVVIDNRISKHFRKLRLRNYMYNVHMYMFH